MAAGDGHVPLLPVARRLLLGLGDDHRGLPLLLDNRSAEDSVMRLQFET